MLGCGHIEAYYKHLSNLIPYNINNVKVTYYGENIADGYATGLDMKLYGEFVPETGSWVTLSLMKTKQNIAGVSVPLPTDQRWGINVHFTDYFPGMRRLLVSLKLALIRHHPFRQHMKKPILTKIEARISVLELCEHSFLVQALVVAGECCI